MSSLRETNPHFIEEQPLRRAQPSHPHGIRPTRDRPQPPPRPHQRTQPPHYHEFPPSEEQPPEPGSHPRPDHKPEQPPVQPPPGVPTSYPHPEHWTDHTQQPRPPPSHPPSVRRPNGPGQSPHGLRVPPPRRTRPITWFAAVFCVAFWVIIILGGLIVLIVYLVYRPRSPRFDVTSATLNAAYLDMGYLLNADLSLLANFWNPNKKVSVDFSYMVIYLYYGSTLIATRAVYPFSAASMQSKFENIEMISSQVQLPMEERRKLAKQIERGRLQFEVKGIFRARSNLGSFLRYSYWLYGRCTIVVTSPPTGVLIAKKCRTKR